MAHGVRVAGSERVCGVCGGRQVVVVQGVCGGVCGVHGKGSGRQCVVAKVIHHTGR